MDVFQTLCVPQVRRRCRLGFIVGVPQGLYVPYLHLHVPDDVCFGDFTHLLVHIYHENFGGYNFKKEGI